MRTLKQDMATPVKYISRVWLRRSTMVLVGMPLLICLLGEAIGEWFLIYRDVWRLKLDPARLPK